MTKKTPEESGKKLVEPKKGTFKKGYDPRRWMNGAPRKPHDKKLAEELLEHIIWDVLSEEIKITPNGEKIDRLRAMIRSMTNSRQSADRLALLDRIAGKVMQNVDVTSRVIKVTLTDD